MHVYAAGYSSQPSPRPVVTLPRIPDTSDERLARTIGCEVCNAPPSVPCHQIRWSGNRPALSERRHHSRRLKAAGKLEERRQRIAAEDRRSGL